MKKFYYPIILIVFLASNLSAQSGWNLIHTFDDQFVYCIAFKDSLNGFAGSSQAASKIYKTTDGGISWFDLNINGLNAGILKIVCFNSNFIIGVGTSGTVIKTTDGGDDWSIKIIDDVDIRSVCITNDRKLFACSNNKIYKSTDEGETWNIKNTDAAVLWDVAFVNSTIGFAVGLYNTSIETTDGGETWFNISPIIKDRSMFSVKFVNKNVGFVVGGSSIAKTTDSGNSWQTKFDAEGIQLNVITTFGENTAWVVGSDKILKTTNGGENWNPQFFSPYSYLLTAACVSYTTCYALGSGLYKTTDGGSLTGINEANTETNNFNLYQNYPNPFNPATTIQYQIPQAGFVTLKVYDMLGKEITTLVNEQKQAGNYQVEYTSKDGSQSAGNGSSLSSGVYLYRLQVGSYTAIKKFLLLK